MSHYRFIKCCCFQLCNAFRQNMEIDQCLLESLPLGQRQRLVRRMRCDQLRAYYERERSLQKQNTQRPLSSQRKKHSIRFSLSEILQDAIIRHDDKEVLKLLKQGADLNTVLPSGGSLLHLCARHDNVFAAEILIERGLNVNLQDEDLWTALHVACACDHTDVMLLLLLSGVNPLLQDVIGNVPLDYAREGSETSYILSKHLEECGVDVSSIHQMKTRRASVMLSDVRQLVSSGVSVNQRNEDGVTLLHIACASGYREVVYLLLENGADVLATDDSYWTPLHLAAKYGQMHIVTQLLKHKADPTLLNYNQDKPSDIAATDQIADMLLKAEEFWVQRQKDPTLLPLYLEEHCEEPDQDVRLLLKKLTPMALPISKRDSLFEKDTMFRDTGGALNRESSQENGADGLYPSTSSKLEQVKLMPPAPNDDLASLSELTDSSLLYEMQKRFGNNQIYTYIGHILLLINPNKDLPIYSNLVSQLYLSSSARLCSSLPPHIFSSAERAFHMMLQERHPQCFIISGESGSGKSEACKHILKHLAARSCPKGFSLEPRMKHVNAILEAFGHARTPMNANSSRFIKLLSLQYSEKRRTLLRARVYTYMLEKTRLIHLNQEQQNFNIFYLMADGLTEEEKNNLNLDNINTYRYLNLVASAETATAKLEQSKGKLTELKHALRALGFNTSEVENLFVILSSMLLLGELRFTALTDADTAVVSDLQLLDRVAGMLQVSSEELGAAFTSDVQTFKGDVITRRHPVEMSNQCRDLLAKALYGRLFSVLVNNVNSYLQGQDESLGDPALEINILDIAGFEKFQKNNFEQLCVNMVNERIQQYTAELLFQQEQQECLEEGVAMETVRSPACQPALVDFFYQKPQGMLCVLDEESQSFRPSELNLYKRLQAQLDSTATDVVLLTTKDGNGNPPPKDQGPSFTVSHYAGKMSYDLTGSLERNKDALPQNILFVLKSSENVLVRQMFQCKLTQTGSLVPPNQPLQLHRSKGASFLRMPSSANAPIDAEKYLELKKLMKKKGATSFMQKLERCGPVTAAVQLRNSLSEISSKLQLCTPHFVHCVRPNSFSQPDVFDSSLVSTQLQYVGVLEMVHVIRYGYPVRMPFTDFLTRYRELVDTTLTHGKKMSAQEKCCHALQHCKLQGWQLGRSKVFLRYWQADHLNDRCHQLHKKIVTCQKVARGWLVRHRVRARLSYQQREQCNVQRFLQRAEDLGLRAYDSLVIQNAADIARENDRLRDHAVTPPLGERPEPVGTEDDSPRRPVEKLGRVSDAVGRAGSRTIRHFRSSSVPTPLVIDNLVHSSIGPSIKPAFQSVNHSSEEGGTGGFSSPRKQPPPKPKRDPNTRLSASYEAVSAGLSIAPKDSPGDGQVSPPGSPMKTQLSPSDPFAKPRPHSDDYSTMKKIPPPKPKRSPNTKLTGSSEEISSAPAPVRPTDMKLACLARSGHLMGLIQRTSSDDGPNTAMLSVQQGRDDEDVYIEMVSTCRVMSTANSHSPEQNEAVYEEMKYYPHDEGGTVPQVAKPEMCNSTPFSCTTVKLPQTLEIKRPIALVDHPNMLIGRQQSRDGEKMKKDGMACDIPAPFPNLLPHRPPLLVFPPSPVTCSPASDESPLTPLEVKKLPVFETNLNYSSQDGGSPLSPQYSRQRADSTPSLSVLIPDKSTPPLTPPPPAALPPPYRPPSHFPFPPEANFLVLSRVSADSKMTSKGGHGLSETPPGSAKPPYSPVKTSRPEPRRAHSCSSSPLLFNPANGRGLTSPLDELNTLFSSGRSLLRKSTTGRKIRDSGFSNSNMNLPGREEQGPTTSSPQLQDKNANHRTSSPNSPIPAPMENGNQISSGMLEDEGHHKSIATSASTLHRHMDSHHTQDIQRLCVGRKQVSTFQELMRRRRSVCDGQRDWQNAWLHTQNSPTLLLKHKRNTTKKSPH